MKKNYLLAFILQLIVLNVFANNITVSNAVISNQNITNHSSNFNCTENFHYQCERENRAHLSSC